MKKKRSGDMHFRACKTLVSHLDSIGFKCLPLRHSFAKGPDVTAINDNSAYRFEVKTLIKKQCGSWQADKVELARRSDDFVCVVHGKYLLIEPMRDYLKACSLSGCRSFTEIALLYDTEETVRVVD